MDLSLKNNRKLVALAAAAAAILALVLWRSQDPDGPGEGFVSGNGRIEATEINVAAKLPGRVQELFVGDGDFVSAGDVLVRMQTDTLEAQRDEARAMHARALASVETARAELAVRQSDLAAAQAAIVQAEAELDAAERRLARSENLVRDRALSEQEVDDDRAHVRVARAALTAAEARALAAEAAVSAARTQITGAESAVEAAAATIERIEADIEDSLLRAPRDGRVQYVIARPGEVVGTGAPVLNLVDLTDVYMTFFLPEQTAGRVALGTEARIVLDAAPDFVIPARVSFVASTAQFTPRTVETESERQKLMFRVRAHIPTELLEQHIEQVKTGLPGVAWIKLDPGAEWPASLSASAVE